MCYGTAFYYNCEHTYTYYLDACTKDNCQDSLSFKSSQLDKLCDGCRIQLETLENGTSKRKRMDIDEDMEDQPAATTSSSFTRFMEFLANGTSMDELFAAINVVYASIDKDPLLKPWFKQIEAYIRKIAQRKLDGIALISVGRKRFLIKKADADAMDEEALPQISEKSEWKFEQKRRTTDQEAMHIVSLTIPIHWEVFLEVYDGRPRTQRWSTNVEKLGSDNADQEILSRFLNACYDLLGENHYDLNVIQQMCADDVWDNPAEYITNNIEDLVKEMKKLDSRGGWLSSMCNSS